MRQTASAWDGVPWDVFRGPWRRGRTWPTVALAMVQGLLARLPLGRNPQEGSAVWWLGAWGLPRGPSPTEVTTCVSTLSFRLTWVVIGGYVQPNLSTPKVMRGLCPTEVVNDNLPGGGGEICRSSHRGRSRSLHIRPLSNGPFCGRR